jgi:hypothetical protein
MAGAEGAAVAAAAEAERQRNQEEEEEVTPMNTDSSGAVEYKIIRSSTRAFKDPAKFRAALEEEARAGWALFEKLDDGRVRLRRPITCRERDALLDQDPYRIRIGISETTLVLWIVTGVFLGIFVVLGAIGLTVKLLAR